MLAASQPVRSNPSFKARSGNPFWSFTRLRRSSPQANATRPSSRNETFESLSSGLIPITRMLDLQTAGNFQNGGLYELRIPREPLQGIGHAAEQAIHVRLGLRVGGSPRKQR